MIASARVSAPHQCAEDGVINVECPDCGTTFNVPGFVAGAIVGCIACPWEGTVCTALETQ